MVKLGNFYKCIEDVFMDDPNDYALPQMPIYRKGKIYESERDNCITDENDDKGHVWHDEHSEFSKHFQLVQN